MALSDGEKLIITMLADIQEKLGAGLSVDPLFIRDNVEANFWAIKMKYHGIFSGSEPDKSKIEWVTSKLDMWRIIEDSFAKLDDDGKRKVISSKGAHGREPKLAGFDGHSEYPWIANTLIQDLGYWSEFAGRDMDSHTPDTETHERMYEVYKPLRDKLHSRHLSADELVRILDARIHPDYRA